MSHKIPILIYQGGNPLAGTIVPQGEFKYMCTPEGVVRLSEGEDVTIDPVREEGVLPPQGLDPTMGVLNVRVGIYKQVSKILALAQEHGETITRFEVVIPEIGVKVKTLNLSQRIIDVLGSTPHHFRNLDYSLCVVGSTQEFQLESAQGWYSLKGAGGDLDFADWVEDPLSKSPQTDVDFLEQIWQRLFQTV
jgi:hypothetical protein